MEVFHSVTRALSLEVGWRLVGPPGCSNAVIWPAQVSGLYILHLARKQIWQDRSSEATQQSVMLIMSCNGFHINTFSIMLEKIVFMLVEYW